jgi:hypothetical protein
MEPIISRELFKQEIKQLVNEGIDYLKAVSMISNKHKIDFMYTK